MEYEEIRQRVAIQKRKMYIAVGGVLGIAVLALVAMNIYYELTIQALVGAVYHTDEQAGRIVSVKLFEGWHNFNDIGGASQAMKSAGYTENGFSYYYHSSGQLMLLIALLALIVVMAILVIHFIRNLGQQDLYGAMVTLSEKNLELSKELDTSVVYAQKRNKQLQDFTENIAHQVKIPLAGLSLSMDLVDNAVISDETVSDACRAECSSQLNQCQQQVTKVTAFIQRLLKISRMESGKVIMAKDAINAKELLTHSMQVAGVTHETELVCEDSVELNGDTSWLEEAFVNILGNTAEYISQVSEGRIWIHVSAHTGKCVINIEDNGPGFGESHSEEIFDRFHTKSDSNSFHVGIGLNLSKLIIEDHKGTIQAMNSESFGGACFRIVLPQYVMKTKI